MVEIAVEKKASLAAKSRPVDPGVTWDRRGVRVCGFPADANGLRKLKYVDTIDGDFVALWWNDARAEDDKDLVLFKCEDKNSAQQWQAVNDGVMGTFRWTYEDHGQQDDGVHWHVVAREQWWFRFGENSSLDARSCPLGARFSRFQPLGQ